MSFVFWVTVLVLAACGQQRPSSATPKRIQTPAPVQTPTPTPIQKTPTPQTSDGNAAFAGRIKATANEITEMRTLYVSECSICHYPVERSTKRAVTLARMEAAGLAMAVPLHTDLLQRGVWPRDVKDTKDDEQDTAVLNASAVVEVLK